MSLISVRGPARCRARTARSPWARSISVTRYGPAELRAAAGPAPGHRPGSRRATPRGFTLVEVLLAVIIVAVGVTAVVSVAGAAVRTTRLAQERLLIVDLLENEVVNLRGQAQAEQGLQAGRTQWAGPASLKGVIWETALEPTADPLLLAVTVKAEWTRSGQPATLALVTNVPAKSSES